MEAGFNARASDAIVILNTRFRVADLLKSQKKTQFAIENVESLTFENFCQALMEAGANARAVDAQGRTASQAAEAAGHTVSPRRVYACVCLCVWNNFPSFCLFLRRDQLSGPLAGLAVF